MLSDNESHHHGVSHKPGRPEFSKSKSDHKKKYEAQEKVGRGRKNKVYIDEARNWRNNKISKPSTKMRVDILSLKNVDKKNKR